MLQQDANELETECGVATSGPEAEWEAEWKAVDRRLREHARHRSALDAVEAFDLLRAEQLKIYVCFGSSASTSTWSACSDTVRIPRESGCVWRGRSRRCPRSPWRSRAAG